jgi:hypothetical protein
MGGETVRVCSADEGQGPEPDGGGEELATPGPTARNVQLVSAGAAGDSSGDGDEPASDRLGHDWPAMVESEGSDPAQQVVGEGADDDPGGVGEELA